MPDLPSISIITPSFNQGAFIERTIQSVLNQGYPDLQYIVMDGGSTDETVGILKAYGDRLTWVSEPDHGQGHAINKGLRRATGDIVAYLNSDDELEPGALRRIGAYFKSHRDAEWVTGKCRIIDPQGRETRRSITAYKNAWMRTKSYQVLLVLNYISQPATFWRRSMLESIGYFDESLHYTLDYDYWLRIGGRHRLHVLDGYIARFRVHPDSKGGTSAQKQFDSELAVAKHYTQSGAMLHLHRLHAQLILAIYRRLAGAASRSQVAA